MIEPCIPLAQLSYVNPLLAQRLVVWSPLMIASNKKRDEDVVDTKQTPNTSRGLHQQEKEGDIVGQSLGTIYAPDGKILVEGDPVKQPALAATLQKIADDPSSFYLGSIADDLVADIQANGGIITKEDMQYFWNPTTTGERGGVREPDPLSMWYAGYELIGASPPISGGSCTALSLNLLEPFNFGVLGNKSSLAQHYLIESWKWAFADRSALGDPLFVNCSDGTLFPSSPS